MGILEHSPPALAWAVVALTVELHTNEDHNVVREEKTHARTIHGEPPTSELGALDWRDPFAKKRPVKPILQEAAVPELTLQEQLAAKISDPDALVIAETLYDHTTPASVLLVLAHNANDSVRYAVAAHESTTPEVLAALSEDEDFTVRIAVAENPHTATGTLQKLGKDPEWQVHGAVARNPSTPH